MKKALLVLTISLVVCNTLFAQQKVGIGTSIPTEKLHIDSGNIKIGKVQWQTAADNVYLKFGDGDFATIGEAVGDDILIFNGKDYLFHSVNYPDAGVGIGISTSPTARLEVNGNVKITDGTQGPGKVLTSDFFGTASWQAPVSFNSGFKATSNTNIVIASGFGFVLGFNTEEYDDGLAFSGGSFTAPVAGLYHFDATISWTLASTISTSDFSFWINASGTSDSHFDIKRVPSGTSGTLTQTISCDFKLFAGNVVQIKVQQNSGGNQTITGNFANNKYSFFSGHRIY